MKIGACDTDERVFIVAEIGNNHEGDVAVAHAMIEAAARCGVDAVKFQTFRAEAFAAPQDQARFQRLKSFELSHADFEALARAAGDLNLVFLSTPLDIESALFLRPLVSAFKIASGDSDFLPLLEEVTRTKLPLIVSSGISDLTRLEKTVSFVEGRWAEASVTGDLGILHCVSSYPTPPEEANLLAIRTLQEAFPRHTIGYSDHTKGVDACVAAVAMGARIIEKHFTLDQNYSTFRDHSLSSDPAEMADLVVRVRRVESMLGDGRKSIQASEEVGVVAYRRSVVAGRDLPAGHVIRLADLTWMRPGGGIAPGDEGKLLGKVLMRPFTKGEPIALEQVRDDGQGNSPVVESTGR